MESCDFKFCEKKKDTFPLFKTEYMTGNGSLFQLFSWDKIKLFDLFSHSFQYSSLTILIKSAYSSSTFRVNTWKEILIWERIHTFHQACYYLIPPFLIHQRMLGCVEYMKSHQTFNILLTSVMLCLTFSFNFLTFLLSIHEISCLTSNYFNFLLSSCYFHF